MGKRRIRVSTLVIIVALAAMGIAAYVLITHQMEDAAAEDSFQELRDEIAPDGWDTAADDDYAKIRARLEKLKKKNGDFVCWLHVPGTRIDYPVMQTKDDEEYYLHRDFKKQPSANGTLFCNAYNSIDPPTSVITIYGHHMKSGAMFGTLKYFEEKEFYNENKYIRLDTLKERREYRIIYVCRARADDDTWLYNRYVEIKKQEELDSFLGGAEKRKLFGSAEKSELGDEFVILTTCEYSQNNGRLVVIGKKVRSREET